ncbi:MAG: type II toxin-antitoxin system PemK/MazF family toxin [Candidatus Hydrogenedentes bacterium]|nr:type II toxin-antitoxin system PemK/MazF family toxin [Candidatus Hydrogenedentota bacterium]
MATNPRHGEIWLADLGLAGKTRPVVILIADNLNAPRTLIIYVPITRQSRGSELEIPLGHLRFLDIESVANVQAIGALPRALFEKRLGVIDASTLTAIKQSLVKACALGS